MRATRFLALLLPLVLVHPALADESAPVHKVTQSESFVMVTPMYTTIVDAERPIGLLMVAIGLNIPDAALRAETEHGLPVLRDDYLRSLMTYTTTSVRPWCQPDVNEIAARLQRVTDRALKKQGALVLLGDVQIRITR
jgi:hypothetical protein